MVGAISKTIGGNRNQGKVYIFRLNGTAWIETSITSSDSEPDDFFGYSVALSSDGSTLAVGARYKAIGGNMSQGKVYVYTWNGSAWSETGIISSDGAAEDYFGSSVAFSADGKTLAVGAFSRKPPRASSTWRCRRRRLPEDWR